MSAGNLRAAVVTVGEELLSGATVDGNAAWLGRALGALGVPVDRRWTVGDRDRDIIAAVRDALGGAELVIVTGGLGPTEDDRTRGALAKALGVELVEDVTLLAALHERLRAAGRDEVPRGLRSLSLVPRPGAALPNPVGVAPGLLFEVAASDRLVVALPGVPREMKALFPAVSERVSVLFGDRLRPVVSRTLHTTGVPESVLAPAVDDAIRGLVEEVSIAYLPDLTGVDVRLTTQHDGSGAGEAAAQRRLDRLESALAPVLDGHRFESESGDLVETVALRLEERGWWLAVAESCTGGLLAQRWTARPGSSRTLKGGVVAYHNDVKEAALGVPGTVLDSEGAVSEAVARAMSESVAERMGAECGIGITGVAGPGGGTQEKPVGTVWIAATVPGEGGARSTRATRFRFAGDREAVRVRSAQAALHLLLSLLDGVPESIA